jgi:hypothetical protein
MQRDQKQAKTAGRTERGCVSGCVAVGDVHMGCQHQALFCLRGNLAVLDCLMRCDILPSTQTLLMVCSMAPSGM